MGITRAADLKREKKWRPHRGSGSNFATIKAALKAVVYTNITTLYPVRGQISGEVITIAAAIH
jgi:hypothetical protein